MWNSSPFTGTLWFASFSNHLFWQRTENISTVFFLMSVFNSEIFSLPERLETRAMPHIPVYLSPLLRNYFCRFSLQRDWAWWFQHRTDPSYQVWSLHAEHTATGITPNNYFLSDLKACLPGLILGEDYQGISDQDTFEEWKNITSSACAVSWLTLLISLHAEWNM